MTSEHVNCHEGQLTWLFYEEIISAAPYRFCELVSDQTKCADLDGQMDAPATSYIVICTECVL
jgi:hypothetical protein